MTDLPEHDASLICNRRSAERFLEMIRPSQDSPTLPIAPEPADDRPWIRSSHTFVIKDDVPGRNDPALSKTLVGSLDQHFAELERANVTRRAGIFLQLPAADAIVADLLHGVLDISMPVPPSLIVGLGWSPPPDLHPREQRVWLLSEPLAAEDQRGIAERLSFYGAVVQQGKASLVRIPGFFVRDNTPLLVSGRGSDDSCGTEAVRHEAVEICRTFFGRKPIGAAA